MKLASLVALSCMVATPCAAKIDENSKIKSTRIITMPADAFRDCLALSWGAPLIVTKQGENTTRLGFEAVGVTFSVLLLTPVDGGLRVDRQGNRIGEAHMDKCLKRA